MSINSVKDLRRESQQAYENLLELGFSEDLSKIAIEQNLPTDVDFDSFLDESNFSNSSFVSGEFSFDLSPNLNITEENNQDIEIGSFGTISVSNENSVSKRLSSAVYAPTGEETTVIDFDVNSLIWEAQLKKQEAAPVEIVDKVTGKRLGTDNSAALRKTFDKINAEREAKEQRRKKLAQAAKPQKFEYSKKSALSANKTEQANDGNADELDENQKVLNMLCQFAN